MKLHFCNSSCKTQFNRDISDGTVVNTKSIALVGKNVCVNCFEENTPANHTKPNKRASLTLVKK
jgi:hypothetical protein